MKKIIASPIRVIVIIILGVLLIMTGINIFSHPLFRSSNSIMNDVIKLTPMGTHIDDVAEIVKNKKIIKGAEEYKPPTINYEEGYIDPDQRTVPGWPTLPDGRTSIVGHKSVRVYYNTNTLNLYFGVFWGFDEEGKLVDIYVLKDLDMISLRRARRTAN